MGANIGDSTLYVASLDNIKYVYGYEVIPNTFKNTELSISLNKHLAHKIQVFNYGWYNEDSVKTINTFGDNPAVHSIDKDFTDITFKDQDYDDCIDVILKESKKELINILKKHPHSPIVLKLDIEGAEYECLENIDDTLQYVDIVLVEWHFKGYKKITDILEKNNFVWFNEICDVYGIGYIRAHNKNKKKFKPNIISKLLKNI